MSLKIDPKLDLVFERTSSLSVEKLWQGWTDPETLKKWFCPRPWRVTDCRIDLRAGGEFYTFMQGPDGEKMPNNGCYLEVIPNQKLVWTCMMTKDFRPVVPSGMGFGFVASLFFSKSEKGSTLKAVLCHADEESRQKHEKIGFQEGWGKAYDQLIELTKA